MNLDDYHGGLPCIPFLLGSRQSYFLTTITGKHGAKAEGVGCRYGTPSKWKPVTSTKADARRAHLASNSS